MPQMCPWSRIEYKFLSQNVWICAILLLLKKTQNSTSMVLWADSKHLKSISDIHEVNLSHMHSMLLAIALLQHSHKKLTANHDVLPVLFTSKRVLP